MAASIGVAGTPPRATEPPAYVSVAGMVARTMATTTTAAAGTVRIRTRNEVKKVPCRMGRSTKKNDADATASVGTTRTANRGHPVSPVRAWLMKMNSGKCQRYVE